MRLLTTGAGICVLLFLGCGDSGTDPDTNTSYTETISANAPVWSLVGVQGKLQKFDLPNDTVLIERSFSPFDTSLEKIATGFNSVWGATYQGSIIRMDTATLASQAVITPNPADPQRITGIVVRENQIWAWDRVSAGTAPRAYHINTTTNTVSATINFAAADSACYSVDVGPNAAYALVGHPMRLIKMDPLTNTIVSSLGVGLDTLTNTRGDFNGKGMLAVVNTTGWVLDQPHTTLLKIDLISMTISESFDVSGLLSMNNERIDASSAGVFITQRGGSTQSVLKID
jgi:hypothetical protein